MIYIGIDNGVSGSIGWVDDANRGNHVPAPTFAGFCKIPVRKELNYTKTKQNITRIDHEELKHVLTNLAYFRGYSDPSGAKVIIERPMVNPMRFRATTSALRALEAVLIMVEQHRLPRMYADSRDWQRIMLPKGIKGPDELKKASRDIGIRLFPSLCNELEAHGDADSLLMAEWARRIRL